MDAIGNCRLVAVGVHRTTCTYSLRMVFDGLIWNSPRSRGLGTLGILGLPSRLMVLLVLENG